MTQVQNLQASHRSYAHNAVPYLDPDRQNPEGARQAYQDSDTAHIRLNTDIDDEARTSQAIAEGRRIYVGNLLYKARKADVWNLLTDAGFAVDRIDMSVDPFTSRNPSYCFVEFSSKEEADRALRELQSMRLLGRPMRLGPCSSKSRQPAPRTFDRYKDADRAEDHYVDPVMEGRRVYVGNLPKPANGWHQEESEAMIAEIFQGYNPTAISKVNFPTPAHVSKPRGHFHAYVDFDSRADAERAVEELQGAQYAGQRLVINFAKKRVPRKVLERGILDVEGPWRRQEKSPFDEIQC